MHLGPNNNLYTLHWYFPPRDARRNCTVHVGVQNATLSKARRVGPDSDVRTCIGGVLVKADLTWIR
jgi:hypothetical protein